MVKIMNKCRKFDTSVILRRFYVIKNKEDQKRNGMVYKGDLREGEKLRPIGCPDIPSRVISRSMTDLTYAICSESLSDQQHGFRLHRGTHTAITDIVEYIKKNPTYKIYEFDFKSFFNFVSPY
jgi:retron-type reverse transcriptase